MPTDPMRADDQPAAPDRAGEPGETDDAELDAAIDALTYCVRGNLANLGATEAPVRAVLRAVLRQAETPSWHNAQSLNAATEALAAALNPAPPAAPRPGGAG